MNPQELISTLKSQHRNLESDLALVLAAENGKIAIEKLNQFKNDLTEHLKLEDGTFYPDYLAKKIQKGEEVETAKKFIQEMMEIAKVVMAFFDKFDSAETVDENISEFREALRAIIGVLKARIETEEEGVYDFYLLM